MQGTKISISTESLKCFFILLLYFRPASYVIGDFLDSLANVLLLALLIVFMIEALVGIHNKVYKPSVSAVLLFLLFFWELIGSTAVNNLIGNSVAWKEAIRYFSCAAGFIIFLDIQLSRRPKQFLGNFVFVGSIICLLNALSMFLYHSTGGMSEEKGFRYLLAQDNATYYWTWSVMVVTWIYYFLFLKNRKMLWYCIFYSASTIASYFVTWSVTPMIATLLLGLLVLLYRRRVVHGGFLNKIRLESLLGRFNLYWIVALLFNYLMAVVHIYQRFERLIRHYLKKSVTLSGRTAIWDKSIVYFKKAPLIGYGQEARAVTIPRIGFNHTHNIILEILYRGGIIGGVLFLILLIHLGIKSRKINNIVYDFLMLSIFIFLCVTVADFAFYRYTYLIIFLLLEHSEIFANAEARTSFVREKRLRLS